MISFDLQPSLVLEVWDIHPTTGVVTLDLEHSLQGQMTLELDFSHLLFLPQIWDVHLTYRKPCDASLLEWSDLTCDTLLKVKWGH